MANQAVNQDFANDQLYDYSGGQLWSVGIQPNGANFGGGDVTPIFNIDSSVSSDGSTAFFYGTTDGVAGDSQLYARVDDTTGNASTLQISPTPTGSCTTSSKNPTFEGATADGSVVFFLSHCPLESNSNTGTNDVNQDLYEATLNGAHTSVTSVTDLSPDSTDTGGAAVWGLVGFSTTDEGSYVYFTADGQIVPGGGADNVGGETNLYVSHSGTTSSVATLSTADSGVYAPGAGGSNRQYNFAQVTPDGQHVLLSSHLNLPGSVTQPDAAG